MAIRYFETDHGRIAIEVDDSYDRDGAGAPAGFTPKGGYETTARTMPKSFDEALGSLKSYAGALGDFVEGLDVRPREVGVEIGLKFMGEAGFIIAKAGSEVEMKVSLTWTPKPPAA